MSINLINFALAKKDWNKAYEDLKVLEIGGRNLLEGNWDLTWEDSYPDYQYLLRPQIQSITDKVSIGDILTFSFDVEAEADTSLRVYDSNEHPGISFGIQVINVKQGKQRVSFTKTLVAGSKNSKIWYMDVYNNNNGVKFSISKIKIEKGHKATDWTPAPEDINAHPFVAELAETVFRSKQNEERIRNLENALTALGGGS